MSGQETGRHSVSASSPRAAALAIGFGTAVMMWAIGFAGRLAPQLFPSALLAVLMFVCLLGAGVRAGGFAGMGLRVGAAAGVVASLVNLLLLGSLLTDRGSAAALPSMLLWVPGSLLFGALTGVLGAALRRARGARQPAPSPSEWTAELAKVAFLATFCLVAIGGLVTSKEAGLAVVDWPNSYGTNMFLYPLSKMVGGIYYEHSHRLFGSLVGLTTLVLCLRLLVVETRKWVRFLGVAALVLVIGQGILGGLRVTGHFTWSDDPTITRPSLVLAMVHGFTGQVFCGLVATLAAVTSATWRVLGNAPALSASRLQRGAVLTLAALLLQLALGVWVRHTGAGVVFHIGMALVVLACVTWIGGRAVSLPLEPQNRSLRAGGALLLTIGWIQALLGMATLAALEMRPTSGALSNVEVALATAHQTIGAALLAAAVAFALFATRSSHFKLAPSITSR